MRFLSEQRAKTDRKSRRYRRRYREAGGSREIRWRETDPPLLPRAVQLNLVPRAQTEKPQPISASIAVEDDGEVRGRHEVLVGATSKDGQEVEKVQEEVSRGLSSREPYN
jgi:hypothetical protein